MASVGFAVGLGNIWKFPYVTGENGGGAFVLVYILCAFCIGVPILIAEVMIGRLGRSSPATAMRRVAETQGASPRWRFVGQLNLLAVFSIGVFYCVVVGWVFYYLYLAAVTGFVGFDPDVASSTFSSLLGDSSKMAFWTLVSLTLTGGILYSGLQKGIERAVVFLMPALFVLLVVLVIFNAFNGGLREAFDYLFRPDFSKINASVVLAAIGQAFFSIGVAMATMMTFGAYLPNEISIPRSAVLIITVDTMVALLAGLVVFPIVFNLGMNPASGPGLIFESVPIALAQMPGGHIVSILFFAMLSFAAITSLVGSTEPVIHWLEEHRGFGRHSATVTVLSVIGVLSLISILGYNTLSEYRLAGRNINDMLFFLTDNVLLPIGGLLIAVFAGWFVCRQVSASETGLGDSWLYKLWYFLIRYPVPIAIALVFILGIVG